MKIHEIRTREEMVTWIRYCEATMENPYAVTLNYLFDTGAPRAPSESQFKKDMNSFSIRVRNRWYNRENIKRHGICLNVSPFKFETTELVGLHSHGIIDVPQNIKRPDIGFKIAWKYGEAYTKKCDENGFADYICKIRTSCHYENFQDNFHFIEWK